MMPTFEQFFTEVWGFPPYPWQVALSEELSERGWPHVLDLPTGSGKTAVLDIALHHLIADGGRTAPRRIVLVVDRRVIVDQVADRARHLRTKIQHGAEPGLHAAREALQEMVGEGVPILESPVLRGATLRDDSWARYPHVPVLAASTVDQVGSRLLFRAYGVSPRMRPIHAGLMGCDTLFLLDEVHLARPFADLLAQLEEVRGEGSEVPRRWGVVRLSATPGVVGGADRVFTLTDGDHEPLAPVLDASKPTRLEIVKVRARDDESSKREALAARAAHLAREMVLEGRRAVAVVVNRVDTARRVWRALETDEAFDTVLLTGRMRPLDQEAQLDKVAGRIAAGRQAQADAVPLVLVSTQAIEAGADFDFDGLVTECASLDALRQRFGRVDRRGEVRDRIGMESRGVILARSDLDDKDAVYGASMKCTWDWLLGMNVEEVDFGIGALQPQLESLADEIQELLAPSRDSAVVMPTYLEQWAQSRPAPWADPDPAIFLHGIPEDGRGATADVRVVWRADFTDVELEEARTDPQALATLVRRLAAVPPGALEALSLPVWSVRRWLTRQSTEDGSDELSDVEGTSSSAIESAPSHLVVDWRGLRDTTVAYANRIPPGALIMVPSERGGLGRHGSFDPIGREPVPDLGDVVQLRQRGRPTLRIDERVWPELNVDELSLLRAMSADETADIAVELRGLLDDELLAGPEPPARRRWLAQLRAAVVERMRVLDFDVPWPAPEGGSAATRKVWVVTGSPSASDGAKPGVERAVEDEDDESFDDRLSDEALLLQPHLDDVSRTAERFATCLDLPERLRTTLRWAGLLHDIGKADPRFKAMLYGADPVAAEFGPARAKSPLPTHHRRARARARSLAGYADGQRHEMVSLSLIEGSTELRTAVEAEGVDWELLLHLVASHHGWARPFAPVVTDRTIDDPVAWEISGIRLEGTSGHGLDRVDSGVARRFFAVGRRYGWHEVAYLEAILRLADHRVSERTGT